MIHKISFLFILALLLNSCTSRVTIDNPTENDIKLVIDGKEHLISAFDSKMIDMKKAEAHILALNIDGEEILNETINISGIGILNPTKSTYIIWKDLYCIAEDYEKFSNKLDIKDLVTINEKEYENVDFEVTKDAFIAENWDYNLNQEFPDSVSLVNDFSIKSKIYTVKKLEDEFGYFGDLDFTDYEEEDIEAFLDSINQVLETD